MGKVKKSTRKFLQDKSKGRKVFHKKAVWKTRPEAKGAQSACEMTQCVKLNACVPPESTADGVRRTTIPPLAPHTCRR